MLQHNTLDLGIRLHIYLHPSFLQTWSRPFTYLITPCLVSCCVICFDVTTHVGHASNAASVLLSRLTQLHHDTGRKQCVLARSLWWSSNLARQHRLHAKSHAWLRQLCKCKYKPWCCPSLCPQLSSMLSSTHSYWKPLWWAEYQYVDDLGPCWLQLSSLGALL